MVRKNTGVEPTIGRLSDKSDEQFISSGIPELDEMIGGLPRGRITELWGEQAIGKTHLVSLLMVNLSKTHKILFVDTEFSLNKQHVADMGAVIKNIDYIADSRLERVTELLIDSIGKYDVIILDSLAYLTPQTVENQAVGENAIGLFARLIKHWIVKFRPRLGISKTAFIVINQYRAPFGMFAKPEPPGGKSWLHAVDVRIYLHTNSSDKIEKDGIRIGHYVHLEVKKSKVSQPFKEVKLKVIY